MPLFQLDPENLADRCRAMPPCIAPSMGQMIWRGTWGFMLVGIIGFAPWAIFEHWFRSLREQHLYIACLVAFIAASGPLLHRLILGPGSLPRFYKLFALAFTAYAIGWIALWVTLRGREGEFLGQVAGCSAMGAVIAFAFGQLRAALPIIAALFAGSALGYYAGDWLYHTYSQEMRYLAMAGWGICYGAGFGAGLGLAFHVAQAPARARL
jgi:hypothetical protein